MEIPVLFTNLTNVKYMYSNNKYYDLCGQMWLNYIIAYFYKKTGRTDAVCCIRTGNNRGGVNRFTHAPKKPSP